MGLFDKIKSLVLATKNAAPKARDTPMSVQSYSSVSQANVDPSRANKGCGITISLNVSSSASSEAYGATAEQLSHKFEDYAFVCIPLNHSETKLSPWFEKKASDSSSRSQGLKSKAWIRPFMPETVAALPSIHQLLEKGINGHKGIAVALRILIKEKRKAKEAHHELLHALYGAAVLTDFVSSFECERQTFFTDLTPHVDFDELLRMRFDYSWMGYARVSSLKKTDVKWLVNEFGEPSVHLSFAPLWNTLRRDAIRRYCRAEISGNSRATLSPADIEAALPDWLRRKLAFSISLDNENKARASATLARAERRVEGLHAGENAWLATHSDFVVADIETTGLDANSCEILELGALLVNGDGAVLQEFSVVLRVDAKISPLIAKLTGISQSVVDQMGVSEYEAVRDFVNFVSGRALFFHNASFDMKFLGRATEKHGFKLHSQIFDTLPIARAAWPNMRSYKLSTLVKIVEDAPTPTHRALADARSALAVLLAAREIAGAKAMPVIHV